MNNFYIPSNIYIIILRYSCNSICEKCNYYLFSKDIVICGKCDKKYCYNCAKKTCRFKWHNCTEIPKCICCLCDDKDNHVEVEINNNLIKNTMTYKFSKLFEYERKILYPIHVVLNKFIKNNIL